MKGEISYLVCDCLCIHLNIYAIRKYQLRFFFKSVLARWSERPRSSKVLSWAWEQSHSHQPASLCSLSVQACLCGPVQNANVYTQYFLPADMKTTFIIVISSSVHLSILGESRVAQLSRWGYFEVVYSLDGNMHAVHLPNHGGKAGIVY